MLVFGSLALLVVVWWPFLSARTFLGGWPDWEARSNYASYAVTSLFAYGEMPFWATAPQYHQIWSQNLQHGFFSNPETEVLSPYVPLYAALGYQGGVRASLVVHLLIGLVGLYLLLTSRGIRHWVVVLLASALLFGSGFLVRHVLVGHLPFVCFTYLPLVLWLYLRALERARSGAFAWLSLMASGLVLALAYYEGAAHLTVHFFFLITVLTAFTALGSAGRRWRTLAALPIVALAFALFAGWKLLPGLAEYGGYRPPGVSTYTGLVEFLSYAIDPLPTPRPTIPAHELSLYLGVTGALVVGAGLLNIRRRTWPLAATALVLLLFLFPPFGNWLADVPVLATQRPTRIRGDVLLLAVILSADALTRARSWVCGRFSPRLAAAGSTVVIGALLVSVVYDEASAVRAVFKAYGRTGIALHDAVVSAPEARLLDSGAGSVTTTVRGINGFSAAYRAGATETNSALIQFPAIGSREAGSTLSIVGGEPVDGEGPLTLRVRGPSADVDVRYRSPYATAGLACSCLGLALFAWLVVATLRSRRVHA